MASVYKWKVSSNKYVYITSEDVVKPFIYNVDNCQREYYEETVISCITNETAIEAKTPTTSEGYREAFLNMLSLLGNKGYETNTFNDYTYYFNYDGSACYEEGSVTKCPLVIFERVKTLGPGEPAYCRLIRQERNPDGEWVFYYELGIPKGNDGAQGPQGIQGEQGEIGENGADGSDGAPGSTGPQGAPGVDGVTRFVSFIFTRSNDLTNPDAVQLALNDYTRVHPDETVPRSSVAGFEWSDGIPSGEAQVWMSNRMFSSNAREEHSWSKPEPATDTALVDYQWNQSLITPEPPLKEYPNDTLPSPDDNGWYDAPVSGAIWMAVRTIENGEYTDEWTILKIKGEKGDAGEAINIGEPMSGEEIASLSNPGPNEAHLCTEDYDGFTEGHLYTWSESEEDWVDCGPFQGEPGKDGETSYVHIKYANAISGSSTADTNYIDYLETWLEWSGEGGETPNGQYMGIYADYSDTDSSDFQDYNWSYSKGKDGFGYEWIFCGTKTSTPPDTPISGHSYHIGSGETIIADWDSGTTVYQNNTDFIPGEVVVNGASLSSAETTGWQDNLASATKEWPFVWEVYRKKNGNGQWDEFMGTTDGVAALTGNYSESPMFRSTIFTRSNDYLTNPNWANEQYSALSAACQSDAAGTYVEPCPGEISGVTWEDGIPTDSTEVLWMSERIFVNDTEELREHLWSKPVIAEDGADIDYEWIATGWTTLAEAQENPPLKTSPSQSLPPAQNNGWYDEPVNNATWMAQRNVIGGDYNGDWTFSQIKGEKGADGTNGKDGKDGKDGIDGKDGKDGAAGANGVFYGLEVVPSAIKKAMSGNTAVYIPSNEVACTAYKIDGPERTVPESTCVLKYSLDGNTYQNYSGAIPASSIASYVIFTLSSGSTKLAEQAVTMAYDGVEPPTLYTWIKYADDAQGHGMSDNPIVYVSGETYFKEYIGFAYNKPTETESDNPLDYTWALFKGTDGDDGAPGPQGPSGETMYTWIKYSDGPLNEHGYPDTMYDVPTLNTNYIGIAANKNTIQESGDPSEYTWSLFRGKEGEPGGPGKMLYPAGAWNSTKTYYTTDTTTPYVSYGEDASGNTIYWYIAADASSGITGERPYDGSDYWEHIESFSAVYAQILMADFAKLDSAVFYDGFMFSQQGVAYESYSSSGVTGSTGFTDFLIIRGTQTGEREPMGSKTVSDILENSAFVPNTFINYKTGEIYSRDITIENSLHVPFKKYEYDVWGGTPSSYEFGDSDNIYLYTDGSKLKLPCDTSQNGRRVILLVANGNNPSPITAEIFLNGDGYYFFEDGIKKRTLHVENETVEIIGYGDHNAKEFYGWVVLNRKQSITNGRYGHELRVLCYGDFVPISSATSAETSSSATFNNFYSFDGTLTAATLSEYNGQTGTTDNRVCGRRISTGKYEFYFPKRWAQGEKSIILTPIKPSTNMHVSVSISAKTSNCITVCAGDGTTSADTSFQFELFNRLDWTSLMNDSGDINSMRKDVNSLSITAFAINGNTSAFSIGSGQTSLGATATSVRNVTYTYSNGTTETATEEVSKILTSADTELYLTASVPNSVTINRDTIIVPENPTRSARTITIYVRDTAINYLNSSITITQQASTKPEGVVELTIQSTASDTILSRSEINNAWQYAGYSGSPGAIYWTIYTGETIGDISYEMYNSRATLESSHGQLGDPQWGMTGDTSGTTTFRVSVPSKYHGQNIYIIHNVGADSGSPGYPDVQIESNGTSISIPVPDLGRIERVTYTLPAIGIH